MVTVTKEMRFECSHLLSDYEGRCSNLHGHSYKVEVTATRNVDAKGFVIDFSDLKEAMNEAIDPFDHAFIYNQHAVEGSTEQAIANLVVSEGKRNVAFAGPTTSENMAAYFARCIQGELIEQYNREKTNGLTGYAKIICVRLWETATSYAEYFPEV